MIKSSTQGLRCSNLQSGSLYSWLCITTNILWRGCMYNKVLGYKTFDMKDLGEANFILGLGQGVACTIKFWDIIY